MVVKQRSCKQGGQVVSRLQAAVGENCLKERREKI
jgi:hypothetical protein